MADVLRCDSKLSGNSAIGAVKNGSIRQVRRCSLNRKIQLKPPDCETKHNARFHNLSRGIGNCAAQT